MKKIFISILIIFTLSWGIAMAEEGFGGEADNMGDCEATRDINANGWNVIDANSYSTIVGTYTTGYLFGDGGDGIHASDDSVIRFFINNTDQINMTGTWFGGMATDDFIIRHSQGLSYTIPVYSWIGDTDTGLGHGAANSLSLIAGGFEAIGVTSNTVTVNTDLDATGYTITAASFNATGSSYRMNGNTIINNDGALHAFTSNSTAITLGTGAAGVYYKIVYKGADRDGVIEWEYDHGANGRFNIDCELKVESAEFTEHLHTNEIMAYSSSCVKIEDVLNLNPISAPPIDNMPEGSLYYDNEDNQVYYSTSSTNETTGAGWQTLNIYNHIIGGISCSTNTTSITLTTQNKFYQVTVFTDTSPYYGVTPSVDDDHIEIITDGDYFVICTLSMCATAKTENYQAAIFKNNGQPLDGGLGIFVDQEINDISTYHSISMSGLVTFYAGDTVEAWIRNTDAGGESNTIRHGHINVIKM